MLMLGSICHAVLVALVLDIVPAALLIGELIYNPLHLLLCGWRQFYQCWLR